MRRNDISTHSLPGIAAWHILHLTSNWTSIFLLSKKRIPAGLFYLQTRHKAAVFSTPLLPGKSLLYGDFSALSSKELC